MGMTRRIYTYPDDMGWTPYNVVSTIGAFIMALGFVFQVWQIVYSAKRMDRDVTGDPWDGHTLEWSTTSPAPYYNFAVIPKVEGRDAFWKEKKKRSQPDYKPEKRELKPIHFPKNSGIPFIMGVCFFITGFGLTFHWVWLGVIGLIGVAATLYARSFQYDTEYVIPVDEIKKTEAALGRDI
jgi:cytochrome aa3-600 menaquinol oxidase subunit 1